MQFYYYCATVLKQIETQKENFKTVIFQHQKYKQFPKLYSLLSNLIQNRQKIDDICKFLIKREKINNVFLAKILIFETLLTGRRIKMGGAIMKVLKKHREVLKATFKIEDQPEQKRFMKKVISIRTLPGLPQS